MPVGGRRVADGPRAEAMRRAAANLEEYYQDVTKEDHMPTETKETNEMKETKIVIRTVAQNANPSVGAFSAGAVDAYISGLLAEGWRIFNTHFIGTAPEGYFFAWILVR